MPEIFYAVLNHSANPEKSLSKKRVLDELKSPVNENLLYFSSEKDALHYCQIANQLKYFFDNTKWVGSKDNPQHQAVDHTYTNDEKNEFHKQFYEQLSTNTQSLYSHRLPLHHSAKHFLILKAEIEGNWLAEHKTCVMANRRHANHGNAFEKDGHDLFTISNTPFTECGNDFKIYCRKAPRGKILSVDEAHLCQAGATSYSSSITTKIERMELIFNRAPAPLPNTTKSSDAHTKQKQLAPKEVNPALKKSTTKDDLHLQQGQLVAPSVTQAEPQQTFNASSLGHRKLTLLRDYVLTPTPAKLIQLQKLIDSKEIHVLFERLHREGVDAKLLFKAKEALINKKTSSIGLGWKIAFILTLGIAAIFYGIFKLIQNSFSNRMEMPQKTFNLEKVRLGQYNFWRAHGLYAENPAQEKTRLYNDNGTYKYKQRLQNKQNELAFNKCGELRKQIQFKNNGTVLVKGSHQQLRRWSLFADFDTNFNNEQAYKKLKMELENSSAQSNGEIEQTRIALSKN